MKPDTARAAVGAVHERLPVAVPALRKACLVLLLSLLGIVVPATSQAQPWSGIIDSTRAVDWQANQAGVLGGVPSASWPICNNAACNALAPGGSGVVNKSTIEGAINGAQVDGLACSSSRPCVVRIRPGTFSVTTILSNKSGVVLRGAGASSTILRMTGSQGCLGTGGQVCFKGSSGAAANNPPPAGTANWTGGYEKGSTQITLSNISGTPLAVGMVILLDQLQDTADTGGIAQGENGIFGGDGQVQGRPNRAQTEIKKITAINGNVVTISPGLHMNNWRAGRSPGAWWWGTQAETIENAGIEDLTLEQIGTVDLSNLSFSNAYNCWVQGVRFIHQWRSSILIWQAARITVRDNYLVAAQFHQTTAYGMELDISGDLHIENNIIHFITAPILGPMMGSVVSYNYSINNRYDAGGGGLWEFYQQWTHSSGGGMVLSEGNQGMGTIHDDDAGNSPLGTYFRNYYSGKDDSSTNTVTQTPVKLEDFARALNFVGNVLGRSGLSTQYENSRRSTGPTPLGNEIDPDHSIYALGYSALSTLTYDPLVWQSLLRWGNYDVVTGTARFVAGEIPTTGIAFVNGNAVPMSQTLPPSFVYTSRPAWFTTPWGTPAWPPIGPEVRGGNHPDPNLGGRVWQVPARLCYFNSPADPAYAGVAPDRGVLLFDRATCYGSAQSPPPSPPSNLSLL